jgi:hypothetical protein
MAELKPFPFEHFNMNAPEFKFEDSIFKMQQKIYAECVDMKETAILEAIIRAAKEAGVTELFLFDKQFVVDALTVAIEKWRDENG